METTVDFVPSVPTIRVCILDSFANLLFDRQVEKENLTSFGQLKKYLQDNDDRPLSWWEKNESKILAGENVYSNLDRDADEIKPTVFDGEDVIIIYTKQKSKKIESGVTRSELIKAMRENHLEDKIKSTYGRNWTTVSTNDIAKIVQPTMPSVPDAMSKREVKEAIEEKEKEVSTEANNDFETLVQSLTTALNIVKKYNVPKGKNINFSKLNPFSKE